jgi:4'-phosphopantetheinyl transferase
VQFSVSHSGDYALLGFRRGGLVGVDIERINEQTPIDEIAPTICSPAELALLGSLGPAARRQTFFRLWTLKEAYLKALGVGLSFPPKRVGISITGDEIGSKGTARSQWRVRGDWLASSLDAPEDYAAAVATAGRTPQIHVYGMFQTSKIAIAGADPIPPFAQP